MVFLSKHKRPICIYRILDLPWWLGIRLLKSKSKLDIQNKYEEVSMLFVNEESVQSFQVNKKLGLEYQQITLNVDVIE